MRDEFASDDSHFRRCPALRGTADPVFNLTTTSSLSRSPSAHDQADGDARDYALPLGASGRGSESLLGLLLSLRPRRLLSADPWASLSRASNRTDYKTRSIRGQMLGKLRNRNRPNAVRGAPPAWPYNACHI